MDYAKNKKNTFLEKVFPSEIEEIKQRRKAADISIEKLSGEPSTEQGLSGIAISGGGIRSATFSLGVTQELAHQGILKSSDYLSTVSGGGYTGSCISSIMNDPEARSDDDSFALKYTSGATEPPALTHLRNSSNYLTPAGLLNKLRLPNILLRGIILNLFIFMPFILAAVFVTEIAYEKGPNWNRLSTLVLPLSLIFLLMTIAFPFAVKILRRFFDWKKRNSFELWLTIPLLLIIIILVLVPILNMITVAIEHNADQVMRFASTQLGDNYFWKTGAIVTATTIVFMLVGKASKNLAQWSGKLLILLIGLLGPAVIFLIYLALCLWQIDSPYVPASSTKQLNQLIECKDQCLANNQPTEFDAFFIKLEARSIKIDENTVVRCQSGNCNQPFIAENWRKDNRVWVINTEPQNQKNCPLITDIKPFENAGINGNCHYLTRHSVDQLRISGNQLNLFDKTEDKLFLGLLIALLIFNRFFLDMNITSQHGFYRDRLSKAYLFNIKDDEVSHADKQKLSDLNKPNTRAPYHLINVALNLQASKLADLRGRKSDFFIFSKRFIGSERTDYTETKEMEKYDNHIDLATAMAISGAAAAPNMGTSTNRSLVFIMTLLNIRLGYWLPNPKRVNSDKWYHKIGLRGAKPTLIWKEALGDLDEKGSHINISDGGHIENLAIYPLLKRQCKYIVAIDGEADPKMTFAGLVKLMRYSRIDMGVEIKLDLTNLRKNKKGNSQSHWVLGDIHYSNGEVGKLLYIKLSVVGDEPEYINAYRKENPKFPHEPTSDQFFTEDQFEAYRALGEHACKHVWKDKEANGIFSSLLKNKRLE